jgi:anti-anti-sigma regulatory factor
MTDSIRVTIDRRAGLGVVYPQGYINDAGRAEVSKAAYRLLGEGYKVLLFNLAETKIVDEYGTSELIEIIEKVIDAGGKLGFCSLTSGIDKSFRDQGLDAYAPIFKDEKTAVAQLKA